MPQKAFRPTKEQRTVVSVMMGCGCGLEAIAQAITNPETGESIAVQTLEKYFPREIAAGRGTLDMLASVCLATNLRNNNMTAFIWYSRNKWGWREQVDHNIGAKNTDGGEVRVLVAFGKDTPIPEDNPKPNGKGNGDATRH